MCRIVIKDSQVFCISKIIDEERPGRLIRIQYLGNTLKGIGVLGKYAEKCVLIRIIHFYPFQVMGEHACIFFAYFEIIKISCARTYL